MVLLFWLGILITFVALSSATFINLVNLVCTCMPQYHIHPLSVNPTKWSDTLKLFVSNLPTNCLSVFGHFVGLALKRFKRIKASLKKFLDVLFLTIKMCFPESYVYQTTIFKAQGRLWRTDLFLSKVTIFAYSKLNKPSYFPV